MAREFLKGIKSENRLSKVRLIMPNDPVIGGQPSDNADEFTSNTPFMDLACSIQYAITQAADANTAAENADTKAANAQTSANQAKTAADNAQKTADEAKTSAANANTAAATADSKAVAAQNTANTANTAAKNADTKAANAQTTATEAKNAAATADGKAVAAQTTANVAKEKVDLVAIQANNNAKEIEKKMSPGDFGIGGYGINDVTFNDFYAFPIDNYGLTKFPIQTGFYTLSSEMLNGWKNNGEAAIYTGQLEVQIRAYRASDEIILKAWEGGVCYINIRQSTQRWTGWFTDLNMLNTFSDKNGFLKNQKNNLDALTTADLDNLIQVPVDQIFYFDSATPPIGFIARSGQAIDKVKMPKLFAKYGTNMPDDRDRSYRMTGTLAGAVGTTQEDAIKQHGHILFTGRNDTGNSHNSGSVAGHVGAQYRATYNEGDSWIRDVTGSITANETRVKSRIIIACNKIQ